MAAFVTPDPGKPHVDIPAVQVFINHGHDVCSPETQAGCIHAVPHPFQFFKMIFNTFIVCACLGVTRLVNIKIICCWLGHGKTDNGAKIFRCIKRKIRICVQDEDKVFIEIIQQMLHKINKKNI